MWRRDKTGTVVSPADVVTQAPLSGDTLSVPAAGSFGPIIKAEKVAFGYTQDKLVLRDISFEVSAGEVLMILGSNGCGKSTLMRLLLNDKQTAGGRILLDGTELRELSPLEISRRVAMVFQDHKAPFPYDVIDVVAMGRTPYLSAFATPRARDMRICEDALESVGMMHLAHKPYTQISGGERQMVLIARALAQETPLIMMDEPTSHLDYRNAAIVIQTANRLASEQNKAVVMVTHLPDQAFYYPSKAALMEHGRFFAFGPSREVLTEANLTRTYSMQIKVLTAVDETTGQEHIMCKPVPESIRP